jgi:ATP-binding protein involved in chromosome partitioning
LVTFRHTCNRHATRFIIIIIIINKNICHFIIANNKPGTGDVQLSICQNIKLSGAVIVSTPQDIALLDARKAIEMFKKVNVNIMGLIQNMSGHSCSKCGNVDYVFGKDGCLKLANEVSCEILGDIPLHSDIRMTSDSGEPLTALSPSSETSEIYKNICGKILQTLKL